jgi:predicted transcriptional regulator
MRGETEAVFDTVARRREFLALLADEPLDKASMVRRLDVSRSTVNRAVSTLESYGFVDRVGGEYRTTPAGVVARRHLDETLSSLDRLIAARPLFAHAASFDPPPALFRDATVVSGEDDRHGPVRYLVDLVGSARRIRTDGALFRHDVPTSVRERLRGEGSLRTEVVLSAETFEWARTYHEPEMREMVDSEAHELRVRDDHGRTTVAVVDTGTDRTVVCVFYDDRDEPVGLVHSSDPAAADWAADRIDRAWQAATPAAAAFESS